MRLRRIAANLLSGSLHSAMTLVLGVAVTPLLIRMLGQERFGAARVLLDWLGYLTLLQFGLVEASRPLLSAAAARSDRTLIERSLATAIRKLAPTMAWKLVAWTALAAVITVVVPVRPELAFDLRRAALVGVLSIAVYPLLPFQILVEAEQRTYRVNLLLLLQALLTSGLALILAWRSWGITGQFAAMVLGGLPLYIVLGWSGVRRFPGVFRLAIEPAAAKQIPAEFGKVRRAAFLINVCSRVSVLTDNILVATLLTSQLVTPFFVTQRLALIGQAQLQGLGNATWAGLSELRIRDGDHAFRRRVVELTRLVTLAGAAVLGPIAAYDESFVTRWVGPSAYGGDALAVLTAVNGIFLGLTSMWGWCFSSVGQYDRLIPLCVVGATLNLTASVVSTRILGLPGPALGTTIMFLVTLPWWAILLRDVLGIPLAGLGGALGRPLALGVGFGVALWIAARQYPPMGWIELALEGAAAVLAYAVLSAAFVLDRVERRLWLARVQALLARRSASPSDVFSAG